MKYFAFCVQIDYGGSIDLIMHYIFGLKNLDNFNQNRYLFGF